MLYIRHTPYESRFQIIFTGLFSKRFVYASNRIYYIVISESERKEVRQRNECVRACMCVFCEYILRCFLKSNFYNRHIVCQNPDSEY